MTLAVAGVGSEFQIGSGASPQVYTKVAECLSIGGPDVTAEEIDVTSLDSTGGYKESITGLKDGGSVALEVNWIKANAQQIILRDALDSGAALTCRIVFSDSPQTIASFACKVTGFSMAAEPDSQLKASLTIKISGQVIWT